MNPEQYHDRRPGPDVLPGEHGINPASLMPVPSPDHIAAPLLSQIVEIAGDAPSPLTPAEVEAAVILVASKLSQQATIYPDGHIYKHIIRTQRRLRKLEKVPQVDLDAIFQTFVDKNIAERIGEAFTPLYRYFPHGPDSEDAVRLGEVEARCIEIIAAVDTETPIVRTDGTVLTKEEFMQYCLDHPLLKDVAEMLSDYQASQVFKFLVQDRMARHQAASQSSAVVIPERPTHRRRIRSSRQLVQEAQQQEAHITQGLERVVAWAGSARPMSEAHIISIVSNGARLDTEQYQVFRAATDAHPGIIASTCTGLYVVGSNPESVAMMVQMGEETEAAIRALDEKYNHGHFSQTELLAEARKLWAQRGYTLTAAQAADMLHRYVRERPNTTILLGVKSSQTNTKTKKPELSLTVSEAPGKVTRPSPEDEDFARKVVRLHQQMAAVIDDLINLDGQRSISAELLMRKIRQVVEIPDGFDGIVLACLREHPRLGTDGGNADFFRILPKPKDDNIENQPPLRGRPISDPSHAGGAAPRLRRPSEDVAHRSGPNRTGRE